MYLFKLAFWQYAFERAVKTVAQAALAALTASTFMPSSVDQWVQVGVISGMAGLYSILTSLTAYSATEKNDMSVEKDVSAIVGLLQKTAIPAPAPAVLGSATGIPQQGVDQLPATESKGDA